MASIYIIDADNTQHQFPLPEAEGEVVSIGSREDCQISLPGIEGLAELHCTITRTGEDYVLADAGSESGTLDGERAISSEPLREGVPYGMGSAYLFFYAEPPTEEQLLDAVPVSEYADYVAPAEAPAAAEEAPAEVAEAPAAPKRPAGTAVKKKKKKAAPPTALGKATLAMASQKRKAQAVSAVNYVYVLLVLALAFYAGMTLRHWSVTGEYLPNLDFSSAPAAKPVKK